jgi:hypothetical protein
VWEDAASAAALSPLTASNSDNDAHADDDSSSPSPLSAELRRFALWVMLQLAEEIRVAQIFRSLKQIAAP